MDKLKNNSDKVEYESNLFLYFDSLSSENKKKYTNLIFSSNIDEFSKLVESIKDSKFNKDNFLTDVDTRKKLIENKKIKIFPDLSKLVELERKSKNTGITKKIKSEIEKILNKRIKSKVSISNQELFFHELKKIYIDRFSEPKDENDFEESSLYLCRFYDTIINCIRQIKNNQNHLYSSNEEKYFLLIFFAPIVGHDVPKISPFPKAPSYILSTKIPL